MIDFTGIIEKLNALAQTCNKLSIKIAHTATILVGNKPQKPVDKYK